MATLFKFRKAKKSPTVTSNGTANGNPVAVAGEGAANVGATATTTARSAAGGTAVVAAASTGPDYESLYANPQQQAAYLEKRRQGGFNDWQRSKANEKRGGKTFLEMMQDEFDGIASECPDGDINKLTLEQVNRAAVIFAQEGELEHLTWCVALGADLAFVSSKGMCALNAAACFGKNNTLTFLLDTLELNPNKRNAAGELPLTSAGISGHLQTIKLLVARGAWLSGVDGKDNTALHQLIHQCYVSEAIELLEQFTSANTTPNQRFDFTLINYRSKTILGEALQALAYKHMQQMDANPQATINQLQTALTRAIELCKKIKALTQLPYGKAQQSNGRTAHAPVRAYARLGDATSQRAYITMLHKIDPAFVMAIKNDPQSQNAQDDDFKNFLHIIGEIELQQPPLARP